ncbi:MAG: SUMF1/EgtB/PvdO family nonheme iron enzyme [Lachnospiraceae bacterium]|nr:SUMF1/EgtB/PvdO family nonheme iron enzyme [Lachnospiraceae bacterium]
MQIKQNTMIKRIVDVCMTALLLFLMAYQVTGEVLHEWIGIGMTILMIIHQILNRKWYRAAFKGKYNAYRTVTTVINIALFISFALTAFCGMSMSGHAVPFLYGMTKVSFARRMHLSMSHWAFVLMGLHLGMHIPVMLARLKVADKIKMVISAAVCVVAGIGLFLFIKNGMTDYLFFRVPFAFLDYEKAGILVLFENILMLSFWAFIGTEVAVVCRDSLIRSEDKNNPLLPVVFIMVAVITGLLINMISGSTNKQDFGGAGWNTSDEMVADPLKTDTAEAMTSGQSNQTKDSQPNADPSNVQDGFLLINGDTFLMGSAESENWRIDDEQQHEVSVSSFYIDPYETTQEEYERLMGNNPSTFTGKKLPVENISWIDAVNFANSKSIDAGLIPAYTVTSDSVTWDMSANGYRLRTEAEWEYACRAGTTTPFNTEKSLDATEANFYGHYPYEIEENYFNDSVLEARPGEYRQTTVEVGSFEANAWGLYDCHGNVNEWCWDYYSEYDLNDKDDPTGADTGTRHVYRGGGWNDFAKNMRSAYRAAGQADMASYNLGVRLVRNANSNRTGTVAVMESEPDSKSGGKILIAYFSWSGNTRGIAQEIQSQTGADIFEISPVEPYSSDYNTVLMQAQEDQHKQARPKLTGHVENMDDYDTIILGYPNWWASIPMPIASFLEEYDLSGKRIIPFCSHGGGRFGQSLTAIAKLAPDAYMGEGLSVHYSGGASLSDDIGKWLDTNGINR